MANNEAASEDVLASLLPLSELIVEKMLARMGGPALELCDDQLPDRGEVFTLDEAAAELKHSYYWLSRNYRNLGLKPSRVGGKLLFTRKQIHALLVRKQLCYRGRPRSAARASLRLGIKGTFPLDHRYIE